MIQFFRENYPTNDKIAISPPTKDFVKQYLMEFKTLLEAESSVIRDLEVVQEKAADGSDAAKSQVVDPFAVKGMKHQQLKLRR